METKTGYKGIRRAGQGMSLYGDNNTPIDTDPNLADVIAGVTVSRQDDHGYADYDLTRNGIIVGSLNTQYNALYIDGNEYLGCDKAIISGLIAQAMDLPWEAHSGDMMTAQEANVSAIEIGESTEDRVNRIGCGQDEIDLEASAKKCIN